MAIKRSQVAHGFAAVSCFSGLIFSIQVAACPPGWQCLPGHTCPPIDYCVPAQSSPPPEEPIITPPVEQPVAPPPEEPLPTPPPEEPRPTPSVDEPVTPLPVEKPTDPLEPPAQTPPGNVPIAPVPSEQTPPPEHVTPSITSIPKRPAYNTEEARDLQRESQYEAGKDLEYVEVTGSYLKTRIRDPALLSSQIGRLGATITYDLDDDDDSPSDTPPPTLYGEEIEQETVVGIVLKRSNDGWIPEHGNATLVTAKIYVPDPGRSGVWLPSDTARRKMRLTFVARSNEKGKALNADLDSGPQDSPDVYFDASRNPGTQCKDDPVGSGFYGTCVTNNAHNEYNFIISSNDYGSFSQLDVSCEDCVPLVRVAGVYPESFNRHQYWEVAVIELDQNKRATKVPKDANNNQVADGYLPDQLIFMAPDEDSENKPNGNGKNGDGLGAYEEYRGFIKRNGRHKRTDWSKKTLFVENIHQLDFSLFTRASGLETVELESDGHKNRVVNFNHGHGYVVDQHGLILRMMPSLNDKFAGYCFCDRERPKGAEKVAIKPSSRHSSGTIAHELGHAVGMYHHGDMAWPDEEKIRPMTNSWRDLLPGKVHSGPKLCGRNLPSSFKVGVKGDQGSGHHNCIMRYYHWEYVYEQSGGDFDCMTWGSRNVFDDSATGTGPNRMGRTAGDATVGNCLGQMWISSE